MPRCDRRLYCPRPACRLVKRWIAARGSDHGPLFSPVSTSGAARISRLRGAKLRYNLQKRQRQAGRGTLAPATLSRTYITLLLDAGVDVFTVLLLAGHADAMMRSRYDRRGEGDDRQRPHSGSVETVLAHILSHASL